MDQQDISTIAGCSVIAVKVGGAYLQSRFPDAKSIRHIAIPANALGALSWACMNALMPAIGYAVPTVRSAIRATGWGTRHKKLVAGTAVTVMAGLTAIFARNVGDCLPLAAVGIGTVMDYQKQGRYQRLPGLAAYSAVWIPVAFAKGNVPLALAEIFQTVMIGKGINDHDVKNAAGENKSFKENWRAYLYGIFHNAVTGASKKGQVSTDAGHAPIDEQYADLMRRKPNPYFAQSMMMA